MTDTRPTATITGMDDLLRRMLHGWCLFQNQYDHETGKRRSAPNEPLKSLETCFIEACDDNEDEGVLLALFSYWSNDIESIAAHWGYQLLTDPETDVLYTAKNVPPRPSKDHYWDVQDQQWVGPLQEDDEVGPRPVADIDPKFGRTTPTRLRHEQTHPDPADRQSLPSRRQADGRS